MRITGGEMGGRRVKVPAGDRVRPTQDRVRAALFSMLAAQMPGIRMLDLFAGSGAVGIDAVSRGAARVVWVEQDRRHAALLAENVRVLASEGHRVVSDDVLRWLARAEVERFDLVFADPPYAWAREQGFASLAGLLRGRGWLDAGGLFVAEQAATKQAETVDGWELLRDRAYGQTRLVLYRLGDACKA